MYVAMLRAKLHQARVTGADVDYEGSITIDATLLERSGAKLSNGNRDYPHRGAVVRVRWNRADFEQAGDAALTRTGHAI